MRILAISFLLSLSVCASALGDLKWPEVTMTHTGTNTATAVTGTVAGVKGPVLAIHVILGTATNVDVDIIADPIESTEDSITLYSADDVDADVIIRPVFPQHTSAGVAITNNSQPYLSVDDLIKIIISDWAATAKVVRAKVVWEK